MTVAELQQFLANMGAILRDSGGAVFASELNAFSGRLTRFKTQSLEEFGEFLQVAVRPGQPVRPPSPTPKRPLEMLNDLFDRALEPAMTADVIKTKVEELSTLSLADLKKLARDFQISRTLTRKDAVLQAICKRIIDRRASFDRSNV